MVIKLRSPNSTNCACCILVSLKIAEDVRRMKAEGKWREWQKQCKYINIMRNI